MGLGVALLLWAHAHAACPVLDERLEAATAALVDGADPAPAFADAEAALACAPASPTQLARLFLLRGAALQLAGEADAAAPFYAAALDQDEAWFDDRLGPAVRTAWRAGRHGDPGRLTANRPLDVDGRRVESFPATLESGPHALQALDVQWARVLVLPAGEEAVVEVPLTPPPAPAAARAPRPVGWAVAGGVALAGAVGVGALAVAQSDTMAEAPTVEALESAWGAQQALGATAIGLAALGAGGVVLQFVLP